MRILLIHPPVAKACEPSAGLGKLAGALKAHQVACRVWDANAEALFDLLEQPAAADDTWTKRARRNLARNLDGLRTPAGYQQAARYAQAVAQMNRLLQVQAGRHHLQLSLSDYQDPELSPLRSADLIRAAASPGRNIFSPFFSRRLPQLLTEFQPSAIGISLTYLSQALSTFALIGLLRQFAPGVRIVLGGGLLSSWMRTRAWRNPFAGLVDECICGPGEEALLKLAGTSPRPEPCAPDYADLRGVPYLSPGRILPYAASSGCFWNRCAFCPERAEGQSYACIPPLKSAQALSELCGRSRPALIHLCDNALSPAHLRALAQEPPGAPWYGFARVSKLLCDMDFCLALRRSGCVMLKLGLESGDQAVLDALDKGLELGMVRTVLANLKAAGIAVYAYLLFGTPPETLSSARATLDFVLEQQENLSFLNLAIFNLPHASPEASRLDTYDFSAGDLSLYTGFVHPLGWDRPQVRQFLDREFTRHPAIAAVVHRVPPFFTSNHAPFFTAGFAAP